MIYPSLIEVGCDSKGINSQDALAARLGTVREFERSGAIQVNRGQIQITDSDRLKE